MIKNVDTTSGTYGLSATNFQSKSSASSTADIVSSFKEILSTMTMMSSLSPTSSDQPSSSGMSEMMAPLMLMLLEKLIAQHVEPGTSTTTNAATNAQAETVSQALPKSQPSGRPVGGVLTQEFHPGHNGLDFGVPVGTPIKTTMDGKVISADWNNQGYGNLVIVENGAFRTYYAHLSSIPVSVGDSVTAGATIGLSGNTGHSTGPHLHYEIRKNNVPIDPTSVTLGISA
jgi:murein DD-endopeptidase MepM/ murein hydrolase activator NlpD